eukprot:1192377-Prorocentrum_minimum.AAC.1
MVEDAERAVNELNGKPFLGTGRNIFVERAKARAPLDLRKGKGKEAGALKKDQKDGSDDEKDEPAPKKKKEIAAPVVSTNLAPDTVDAFYHSERHKDELLHRAATVLLLSETSSFIALQLFGCCHRVALGRKPFEQSRHSTDLLGRLCLPWPCRQNRQVVIGGLKGPGAAKGAASTKAAATAARQAGAVEELEDPAPQAELVRGKVANDGCPPGACILVTYKCVKCPNVSECVRMCSERGFSLVPLVCRRVSKRSLPLEG